MSTSRWFTRLEDHSHRLLVKMYEPRHVAYKNVFMAAEVIEYVPLSPEIAPINHNLPSAHLTIARLRLGPRNLITVTTSDWQLWNCITHWDVRETTCLLRPSLINHNGCQAALTRTLKIRICLLRALCLLYDIWHTRGGTVVAICVYA